MNRMEIAVKIASKVSLPKVKVEEVLESFMDSVTEVIKTGGEVSLAGFGVFSAKQRKARTGVNPRNPTEKIQIPSMRTPKFKAGKNLKEALK